jgi:hypothetical protein
MVVHVVFIGVLTLLILTCTFLPFLPGGHDRLAVTLSAGSQILGVTGLVLVPIGALWLMVESTKRTHQAYSFAIAAVVAASLIAAFLALAAAMSVGFSLGIVVLASWVYGVSRLWPALKRLKRAEARPFNPVPLYLLVVPIVVMPLQWWLIEPATGFSRARAIRNSAAMIADIEAYRQSHGRYPASLLSLHQDYRPAVIGIERFDYAPNGEGYNLSFEQMSSRIGTREIVMYNTRDEHLAVSHDSDILRRTPEQLRNRGGFYEVRDAASPHWKYFWFD